MTDQADNTHDPTPATEPLALRLSEGLGPTLRALTEEECQLLHYNPNTSDLIEFVQQYAAEAVAESRASIRAALLTEASVWTGDYRVPVHRAISDAAKLAGLSVSFDDCYRASRVA
jgi:hypothetical protein